MKGIHSDKAFTVINYTLLVIITLIILYPLYFTVIASISEPYDVVSGNVVLWPKGFTLDSYRQIFQNEEIWVGFRNSVAYTVFGTLMSLVLTIPAAYALSKKNLWGRGLITTYFVIIMYFSGGLLPTYLVVRFLKYEKKVFIDKVRERNVKRMMMIITLVTFIPSVVIGFHMVRVSLFEATADKYVAQVFNFPHTRVIECNKHYSRGKHPSQIELLLLGEPLDEAVIENARAHLAGFGLEKVDLIVRQANREDRIDVASLQQSYTELLEEKNRRIGEMAAQLSRYRVTDVEVDDISREVGAMMPAVRAISLTKGITFDVQGTPLDTTLVCVVTPRDPADSIDRMTLTHWLRIRTKVANVKLFVEP